MNPFKYQRLRYDINCRNNGVNCWTLYRLVLKKELGINAPLYIPVSAARVDIANEFVKQLESDNNQHIQIDKPIDYCLVLFKYKHASKQCYHCGIYYNGKVLHANGSGNTGGIWYDYIKDIKHDSVEYLKHELI